VAVSHPALSIFADPEEGDLSRVSVRRATPVADLTRDAAVLAKLTDGSPWIVERSAGRGKVILFTTSAAMDDSDFPRTPLFLPILHRLVRYAAAPVSETRDGGDAAESRLERPGPETVRDIEAALGIRVRRGADSGTRSATISRARAGRWAVAVVAALALLGIELALSRDLARGRVPWAASRDGRKVG
jgi:hypothetical protein